MLTFKEALTAQRNPRGLSLEKVAEGAGVSLHILKNANQGKSRRPNAEAVRDVAKFFGVTVSEFYAGVVRLGSKPGSVADLSALVAIVSKLKDRHSIARLEGYAQSLVQIEEAAQRSEEQPLDPQG